MLNVNDNTHSDSNRDYSNGSLCNGVNGTNRGARAYTKTGDCITKS